MEPSSNAPRELYFVDTSTLIWDEMIESTKKLPEKHVRPRQIIGISLTPKMARDVKAYAGQQGISLRRLFEEMWQGHKNRAAGEKP